MLRVSCLSLRPLCLSNSVLWRKSTIADRNWKTIIKLSTWVQPPRLPFVSIRRRQMIRIGCFYSSCLRLIPSWFDEFLLSWCLLSPKIGTTKIDIIREIDNLKNFAWNWAIRLTVPTTVLISQSSEKQYVSNCIFHSVEFYHPCGTLYIRRSLWINSR